MLEDIIIVCIVMVMSQIIKQWLRARLGEELGTQLIPLVVIALAGLLNVANAAVFAPESSLVEALGEGIKLGAIAGGIYSMGKAALGMS